MCYYENFKFACHDWKWGNFKQHCHKEYRTGETCGTKLIYATIMLPDKCPQCEKIDKKLRRRTKAIDDVRRWSLEPGRYRASIEKAYDDVRTLDAEILHLQAEKDRRYAQVGNTRRNNAAAAAAAAAASSSAGGY